MTNTKVIRKPIKIRKPIQAEHCSCWNTKVFSVDSSPFLVVVDALSLSELVDFLDTIDQSTGLYFKEPLNEEGEQKVMLALSKKLPVTIKTSSVLSNHILEAMTKVPHSSIHAEVNFLDTSLGNKIYPEVDSIQDIRDMLYYAKTYKVFTVLSIRYQPHLVPKLDILEIIDMLKNQVSHLTLDMTGVDDKEFHLKHKSRWEALVPNSIDNFRKYYSPDVSTRSWELRPKFKKEFLKDIKLFIKPRKIGMEILEEFDNGNRIRHISRDKSSGLSMLPLGMRPFWYQKVEGVFEKMEEAPNQQCSSCQKPIF